jgi:hypothetical protein
MSSRCNSPRNALSLEMPSIAPRMTRSSVPQMAKLVSRTVASVPVARDGHFVNPSLHQVSRNLGQVEDADRRDATATIPRQARPCPK